VTQELLRNVAAFSCWHVTIIAVFLSLLWILQMIVNPRNAEDKNLSVNNPLSQEVEVSVDARLTEWTSLFPTLFVFLLIILPFLTLLYRCSCFGACVAFSDRDSRREWTFCEINPRALILIAALSVLAHFSLKICNTHSNSQCSRESAIELRVLMEP